MKRDSLPVMRPWVASMAMGGLAAYKTGLMSLPIFLQIDGYYFFTIHFILTEKIMMLPQYNTPRLSHDLRSQGSLLHKMQ